MPFFKAAVKCFDVETSIPPPGLPAPNRLISNPPPPWSVKKGSLFLWGVPPVSGNYCMSARLVCDSPTAQPRWVVEFTANAQCGS